MDLTMRMLNMGLRGIQLDVQFWHYGSASWKLAKDGADQLRQTDRDREYFEKKWGFHPSKLLLIVYPAPIWIQNAHSSVKLGSTPEETAAMYAPVLSK